MLSQRPTTLRLSAMSYGAKMIASTSSSSSSSSMSLRNPSLQLRFSSTTSLFNGGVLRGGNKNRVSFSSASRFAHVSLRCYASSSGFDRVRVQNPIVEMDGEFTFSMFGWRENDGKLRNSMQQSIIFRSFLGVWRFLCVSFCLSFCSLR
jgi:hypothetical protein